MKLSGLKLGVSIRLLAESLRSRKPFSSALVAAATYAFIPELESSGFSAKEDNYG